ncbi:MAG: hypothetical protein HY689_01690 [Chloroflexi bacterium]|nr:hypothetical protein [Chloroflexota bacterium]
MDRGESVTWIVGVLIVSGVLALLVVATHFAIMLVLAVVLVVAPLVGALAYWLRARFVRRPAEATAAAPPPRPRSAETEDQTGTPPAAAP